MERNADKSKGALIFAVAMAIGASFFLASGLYTKQWWMMGASLGNALMSIGSFIDARTW